ncbi:long-chain-fatty-acid--CoA ligase ACSBG2-like [Ctenodactylus gundi]
MTPSGATGTVTVLLGVRVTGTLHLRPKQSSKPRSMNVLGAHSGKECMGSSASSSWQKCPSHLEPGPQCQAVDWSHWLNKLRMVSQPPGPSGFHSHRHGTLGCSVTVGSAQLALLLPSRGPLQARRCAISLPTSPGIGFPWDREAYCEQRMLRETQADSEATAGGLFQQIGPSLPQRARTFGAAWDGLGDQDIQIRSVGLRIPIGSPPPSHPRPRIPTPAPGGRLGHLELGRRVPRRYVLVPVGKEQSPRLQSLWRRRRRRPLLLPLPPPASRQLRPRGGALSPATVTRRPDPPPNGPPTAASNGRDREGREASWRTIATTTVAQPRGDTDPGETARARASGVMMVLSSEGEHAERPQVSAPMAAEHCGSMSPQDPGKAETAVTPGDEAENQSQRGSKGAPKLWTPRRDSEVALRLSRFGPGSEPPLTIPELFQDSVKRFGARPALATKNSKKWHMMTFTQYYQQCRRAARALIKLGLQRFHGVGILGFNSTEWFVAALGAILAGGLCVGIYATSSAEACRHTITQAKVDILVVENDQQLRKILTYQALSSPSTGRTATDSGVEGQQPGLWAPWVGAPPSCSRPAAVGAHSTFFQIPQNRRETLKAIVQYRQRETDKCDVDLYSWGEFLELGDSVPEAQLEQVIVSQKANQCAVLIYTSGTEGHPKAIMLNHDNITWTAGMVAQDLRLAACGKQEVVLSYLPLSHIATQMMDIWVPMRIGALIYFAEPDALKGTLVSTLKEVKPTSFFAVPRVWEKIHETITDSVAKSSNLKKKAFTWAKGVGLKVNTKRMLGRSDTPTSYHMAKALVFGKVRSALGLDHCHLLLSGAAPLAQDTAEFFLSLDLPVGETYGMTECSGPHSMSSQGCRKVLSCGKTLSGCRNSMLHQSKDGIGEVCVWGRHVFMGYLEQDDATVEVVDEDGWLHTGDLGRIDSQGFLYITGRIKELLITANGENVAPIPIETKVKQQVPIVSNAVLVGDKANFLSMLLTLKCETDPVSGEPLDTLTSEAVSFCQSLGSQATTVSEILNLQDPLVYTAIQEGIDTVNQEAASNAQRIRKWAILDRDFSFQGGELGPTSKIKRHFITQKYKTRIDNFYL